MSAHPLVIIIMGSDSDLRLVKETVAVLKDFGIPFRMHVASAHRSPAALRKMVLRLEKEGIEVVVAAAGGAAHLAGVIAAETVIPVVGIPVRTKALNGQDSLYAMVQMPSGVPVGVMAIDGALNAGVFAAEILGIKHREIAARLRSYKKKLAAKTTAKDRELQTTGLERYLEKHSPGH